MSTEAVPLDRWDRTGRIAGYAAAAALTPYLLIKVSWVVGAALDLLPTGHDLSRTEWVVVNTVTVGMAAVAITAALALVRPWGERLPGRAIVAGTWLGAGFLVPVLPYAVVELAAGPGADSEMPAWEGMLIQAGFVGMGAGLALALPVYLRRRWPAHLTGRVGDRRLPVAGPALDALVVSSALTIGWAVWALESSVIVLLLELWALAGVAAVWCLVAGRPARAARGPVMALAWVGSGSLFAWSAWKLPISLLVDTAGEPWVHGVGVVAGALLLRVLLGREVSR